MKRRPLDPDQFCRFIEEAGAVGELRRFLRKMDFRFRSIEDFPERFNLEQSREKPAVTPELLASFYEELRTYGKKVFRIAKLEGEHVERIREVVRDGLTIPESPFASVYPYPIAEREILDRQVKSPVLVSAETTSDFVVLVYASGRRFTREYDLNREYLDEDAPEEIKRADDILVREIYPVQAYDVVIIDLADKLMIIAVDMPRTRPLEPIGAEFGKFDRTLRKFFGIRENSFSLDYVDLKPAIMSIYKDRKEGVISQLSFVCHTGYVRNEKRNEGQTDLRYELYHRAGTEALKKDKKTKSIVILPYKLSVEWGDKNDPDLSYSSLTLSGRKTHAVVQSSALIDGNINEYLTKEGFLIAITRLLAHL